MDCPANSTNSNGLFLPRMSSSRELLACDDTNCKKIYGESTEDLCGNCSQSSAQKCSQNPCPAYVIQYGSGSTAGLLLLETLTLPVEDKERAIRNFVVHRERRRVLLNEQSAGGFRVQCMLARCQMPCAGGMNTSNQTVNINSIV